MVAKRSFGILIVALALVAGGVPARATIDLGKQWSGTWINTENDNGELILQIVTQHGRRFRGTLSFGQGQFKAPTFHYVRGVVRRNNTVTIRQSRKVVLTGTYEPPDFMHGDFTRIQTDSGTWVLSLDF